MADKEKKAAEKPSVDKTGTDEEKQAAAKVAKAAKSQNKSNKPNVFKRIGKSTKRFFKDFKGEAKKIVWPDAKTVIKSTGVVILVVAIVSIIIWGIDTGLSAGISGLKGLASGSNETTTSQTVTDENGKTVEETTAEDKTSNKDETSEKATSAQDESAKESQSQSKAAAQ